MREYGAKINTLYEKNIRINSGDKKAKPYMLEVSKDKDGNVSVSKKYMSDKNKGVVKQI